MNTHFRHEDLSAYIDGELPDDRSGLLKKHCAECEECAAEVRRLERMHSLVIDNDPATDLPEIDMEHAVMRRIRTERAVRHARPFAFQWRWAAVAACAVVALAVVFGLVPALDRDPVQEYVEVELTDDVEDFLYAQPEDWLVAVATDEEDVELIIAALIPVDMMESEIDEPWLDSTVDELVETLTVTELEELREELYSYAIQG